MLVEPGALLDRAQQFAEGDFPLAAHQIVDAHILVSFGGKAGIVSADHDLHSRPKRTHQIDNATGGAALKRHDRESDDVRVQFADQARDSFTNLAMNQDQVSHGHAVMRIDVPRQRRERAVGHADRDRWHVFEGIRHRKQQDVHRDLSLLSRSDPAGAG